MRAPLRQLPLIVALAVGCKTETADPAPPIVPGAPQVGAAEGTLDLPIGTPMGGYSARDTYLGSLSYTDRRQTPYNYDFMPSCGVHTRPGLKVIWITNGDQDLVMTESDTIYSFDGLVSSVTAELERRTGKDLHGRVTHSTNHSHASYGPFSDQVHFFLGGDRFNEEIFERFTAQLVDLAMQAYDSRQPASIGTGWLADWDPNDEVSHDRRGENDDLVMYDDLPPGGYGKDPFLNMIRFDAADGTPIAVTYAIPIHGTATDDSAPMLSAEAGGGVTTGLEEAFDRPVVVMELQTAAGDASPGGVDDGYARIESLSELARPKMMELYNQILTSDAPISLETVSRHIWQDHDMIHVTRNGAVDWSYGPSGSEAISDGVVWASPNVPGTFDEFNAPLGAVFCGSDAPLIPGGGVYNLTPDLQPYSGCVRVDAILPVITAIFDLSAEEQSLPMRESLKAGTLATRFGPIPTLRPDGTQGNDSFLAAYFPGEPTSMYVEHFRRRVRGEVGDEWPLLVGYSQDHQGYYLPPEDWLKGGYEPNINMWGPLEAEHVMEGVLAYIASLLGTTDVAEVADPDGYYAPTEYQTRALPTEFVPDLTPDAGTPITTAPNGNFWTPKGFEVRTLVALAPEPDGSNCADGGTAVSSGRDENRDGALQPSEVTNTTYVCDPDASASAAVSLKAEDGNANCTFGGTAVRSGIDANANGLLDTSEIVDVAYVCGPGPDLVVPETVPRVSGVVQFAWRGGDAMVDLPRVVLEQQDGATWTEVKTRSQRTVDDHFYDMLMAYTPDPLYPVSALQQHNYWVSWQAVPHSGERAALPLGTYRLHVYGTKYAGGSTQWPWATETYEATSPEFEVTPAELQVDPETDGLWVSIAAPSDGWRLISMNGNSHGLNPVSGDVTVAIHHTDGTDTSATLTPDRAEGGPFAGKRSHIALDLTGVDEVVVTDAFGNSGTWTVP